MLNPDHAEKYAVIVNETARATVASEEYTRIGEAPYISYEVIGPHLQIRHIHLPQQEDGVYRHVGIHDRFPSLERGMAVPTQDSKGNIQETRSSIGASLILDDVDGTKQTIRAPIFPTSASRLLTVEIEPIKNGPSPDPWARATYNPLTGLLAEAAFEGETQNPEIPEGLSFSQRLSYLASVLEEDLSPDLIRDMRGVGTEDLRSSLNGDRLGERIREDDPRLNILLTRFIPRLLAEVLDAQITDGSEKERIITALQTIGIVNHIAAAIMNSRNFDQKQNVLDDARNLFGSNFDGDIQRFARDVEQISENLTPRDIDLLRQVFQHHMFNAMLPSVNDAFDILSTLIRMAYQEASSTQLRIVANGTGFTYRCVELVGPLTQQDVRILEEGELKDGDTIILQNRLYTVSIDNSRITVACFRKYRGLDTLLRKYSFYRNLSQIDSEEQEGSPLDRLTSTLTNLDASESDLSRIPSLLGIKTE